MEQLSVVLTCTPKKSCGKYGKILSVKPKTVYMFFKNNYAMLVNSRRMLSMLKEIR